MQMTDTLMIAASGMKAQGERLRVVAENLANANSTGSTPGSAPYRRKTITFANALDETLGVDTVHTSISYDRSPFNKKYDPTNPAADAQGYVLTPNVDTVVEMADMREARRGYEANLNVVDATRTMLQRTLDILRA